MTGAGPLPSSTKGKVTDASGHERPPRGPTSPPSGVSLASVIAIATDAIIFLDEEQRITFFNEGAATIFGYRADEVLGRPLDILLPERFREIHREHVRRFGESDVLSRRMGERQEIFGLRRGGEEFAAEASISRVTEGGRTTFTVVLRDVSDRKRAEEVLRRRERQLAEAQEIAHLGSWEWDIVSNVIHWSDALYRIYGLEPGEVPLTYEDFLERVHPDDRERVHRLIGRAYEEGRSFSFLHRIVRPDSQVRVLQGRGDVAADAEGKPVRMVGTGQDVTERVRAERRARRLIRERAARAEAEKAARHMGYLVDAGRTLVESLDVDETLRNIARLAVPHLADLCVVYVGQEGDGPLRHAAHAHVEAGKEDLLARLDRHYLPDPGNPKSIIGRAFRTGETVRVPSLPDTLLEEVLGADPAGLELARELEIGCGLCVPMTARGRTIGVIAMARRGPEPTYETVEVTVAERLGGKAALALANARLYASERRARAEAEAASRLRDEVLAIVSHDLRTPLNAISLNAELLVADIPAEAKRERAAALQRSVRRTARLVEDLLDVGRIQTQRLTIQPAPTPPEELMTRVRDMLEPQARKKNVDLDIAVPEGIGALAVDPDRVLQIFSNLLDNAIRHTPAGGRIDISAETAGRMVRFSVADTGEGIPPARLPDLFNHLVQTTRDGRAAAGLGLAIVRGIVEAHGGRVWAESEPGEGSVFRFTLPLAGEGTPG